MAQWFAGTTIGNFMKDVSLMNPLERFMKPDAKFLWIFPVPQTVKNILTGSHDGIMEHYINSTPFGIGRPFHTGHEDDWTFGNALGDTFAYVASRGAFWPLTFYDGWRVTRAVTEKVLGDGYQSALSAYKPVHTDYWTTEGNKYGIPKWVVNATPTNNFWVWVGSRFLLAPAIGFTAGIILTPILIVGAGVIPFIGQFLIIPIAIAGMTSSFIATGGNILWDYDVARYTQEHGWKSWHNETGKPSFRWGVDPAHLPPVVARAPITVGSLVTFEKGKAPSQWKQGKIIGEEKGRGFLVEVTQSDHKEDMVLVCIGVLLS